jgi:transcription termination factor NusB
MTILLHGCSFSSGWGFETTSKSWAGILTKKMQVKVTNLAKTSASNQDIFLSVMKTKNLDHDMRLVQWTALNRITVSPSPVNEKVILSWNDKFLSESLPGIQRHELENFTKVLTLLNQDWKHFFDLVDMIEVLQQDTRTYFINGVLPWNQEFFNLEWNLPFQRKNIFLESLLQTDQFDDEQLEILLQKVIQARNRIDASRWVNLTQSWDSSKIDTISSEDLHPGPHTQGLFAEQVLEFLLNSTS